MGVAQRLLQGDPQDLFFRRLELSSFHSLQGIKGLGPAGKARVLASIEIAKRYASYRNTQESPRPVSSELPTSVSKSVFSSLGSSIVEQVGFVALYSDQSVGEFHCVEQGDETQVFFNKSEFLRALLYCRAQGFWMFHNHPDGSQEVSRQDRMCTREVKALSRMLGIQFFGHWILAGTEFVKV